MEHFGIILETYLASLIYSCFLKVHIFLFWKLPCFTTVLRQKGKAILTVIALFFPTSYSFLFSKKIHRYDIFPSLIICPIWFIQFVSIFLYLKVFYAPMGDLTSFSKPAFWPIWIATLCFWISDVVIYLISLLLQIVGWCTLIQYRINLCSNFSLLLSDFCMFD